jgi:hypothetical protein
VLLFSVLGELGRKEGGGSGSGGGGVSGGVKAASPNEQQPMMLRGENASARERNGNGSESNRSNMTSI